MAVICEKKQQSLVLCNQESCLSEVIMGCSARKDYYGICQAYDWYNWYRFLAFGFQSIRCSLSLKGKSKSLLLFKYNLMKMNLIFVKIW